MAKPLSLAGKLKLLLSFLVLVLPSASVNIPRAIVRAFLKALPLRASVWNAFAASLMGNLPPLELQAMLPTSADVYRSWMLSNGKPQEIEVLAADDSTQILWLGPVQGKKVLLFFHGGGYIMPLAKGHLNWLSDIRQKCSTAGVLVDICILQYDLAPRNRYPRQMCQAIFAFQHLLQSGYQPFDIIFGGDSAGAHLALSLMAHLHHPRPNDSGVVYPLELSHPVQGCLLVSPLASLDLNTPSYQRWFSADILNGSIVRSCDRYLFDDSPARREIREGNGWPIALDVPEKWWEGLDVVGHILITAGSEEVFSDHIIRLSDMLQRASQSEVTCWMGNETHDGPLMDFEAGRPPSRQVKAITEWIVSRLKVDS